jgi:hypothetical protein
MASKIEYVKPEFFYLVRELSDTPRTCGSTKAEHFFSWESINCPTLYSVSTKHGLPRLFCDTQLGEADNLQGPPQESIERKR